MGRRTWESLPGRSSIVLTSIPRLIGPAAEVACDLDEALAIAAEAEGIERVWVIGGGQHYAAALAGPRLSEVHVTTADVRVEGDTLALALDGMWTADEVVGPSRSSTRVSYRIDRTPAVGRSAQRWVR